MRRRSWPSPICGTYLGAGIAATPVTMPGNNATPNKATPDRRHTFPRIAVGHDSVETRAMGSVLFRGAPLGACSRFLVGATAETTPSRQDMTHSQSGLTLQIFTDNLEG